MRIEFRKAKPSEIRSLMIFDRKAFAEYPADWFDRKYWEACESWWMIVNGRKVGCCALEASKTTLYIASTAILAGYRGRGLGTIFKAWQIGFAQARGSRRIMLHTRRSNSAMIRLNRKFGFTVARTIARYYRDPDEPGLFMELRF